MTPAGLAVVPPAILDPTAEAPPAPAAPPGDPDAVPAFIRAGLEANPPAWAHFAALAPSHRRAYVRWITAAKREETQARRLGEAIGLLVENRKLPLK